MNRYLLPKLLIIYGIFGGFVCWEFLGGRQNGGGAEAATAGQDLSLTREEKMALDKFKKRVIPIVPHTYMKQEVYLIRWLRARNLNLKKAEEMLKSNLKWRRENKIDTINQEDWSDMREYFPYTNNTFDKEGRPLGMLNFGSWDLRQVAIAGKTQRMQRYIINLMEGVTQRVIQAQKMGIPVTRWKVLMNMDGFNEIQHACAQCLPVYVTLLKTFEDRYPGMVDKMIFINTPATFKIILDLVNPVLSGESRRAAVFLGKDRTEWMKYLDKEINKDQRTREFGGTLKEIGFFKFEIHQSA